MKKIIVILSLINLCLGSLDFDLKIEIERMKQVQKYIEKLDSANDCINDNLIFNKTEAEIKTICKLDNLKQYESGNTSSWLDKITIVYSIKKTKDTTETITVLGKEEVLEDSIIYFNIVNYKAKDFLKKQIQESLLWKGNPEIKERDYNTIKLTLLYYPIRTELKKIREIKIGIENDINKKLTIEEPSKVNIWYKPYLDGTVDIYKYNVIIKKWEKRGTLGISNKRTKKILIKSIPELSELLPEINGLEVNVELDNVITRYVYLKNGWKKVVDINFCREKSMLFDVDIGECKKEANNNCKMIGYDNIEKYKNQPSLCVSSLSENINGCLEYEKYNNETGKCEHIPIHDCEIKGYDYYDKTINRCIKTLSNKCDSYDGGYSQELKMCLQAKDTVCQGYIDYKWNGQKCEHISSNTKRYKRELSSTMCISGYELKGEKCKKVEILKKPLEIKKCPTGTNQSTINKNCEVKINSKGYCKKEDQYFDFERETIDYCYYKNTNHEFEDCQIPLALSPKGKDCYVPKFNQTINEAKKYENLIIKKIELNKFIYEKINKWCNGGYKKEGTECVKEKVSYTNPNLLTGNGYYESCHKGYTGKGKYCYRNGEIPTLLNPVCINHIGSRCADEIPCFTLSIPGYIENDICIASQEIENCKRGSINSESICEIDAECPTSTGVKYKDQDKCYESNIDFTCDVAKGEILDNEKCKIIGF
jgi:hypothetical protein